MCMLCLEIAKDRITFKEVRNALPEMIITSKSEQDKKHFEEMKKATDEELKEIAQDFESKN